MSHLREIINYTGVPEDFSESMMTDEVKVFFKGTDDGNFITYLTELNT